jgi:uncharacterized protein (DUF433 family)
MPASDTEYKHILLDPQGVPWIQDTTMKVVELVMAHQAYGWSPEELHHQFPHLSLGQIYSALAYYWDHRDEIEQDIARRGDLVEELRGKLPPSSLAQRLGPGRP